MTRDAARLELIPGLSTRTKMRLARAAYVAVRAARLATGRWRPQAVVTRNGLRWDLDLREGIDLAIYLVGRFEVGVSRTLAAQVHPGMTVLDLGANVGAHTLPRARAAGPPGRVIAVEPTAWAFSRLQRNLSLNPELSPRVEAIQAALGEPGGEPPQALYASWELSRRSGSHSVHGGQAKATTGAGFLTLDALVEGRSLDRVDLIKLDVDGHEARILRGGAETLARLRPRILLEVCAYTLAEHGERLTDLLAPLEAAGYVLRNARGEPLSLDAPALERALPTGGSINALAVPS